MPTDVIRTGFVLDTPSQADAVVNALAQHFPVLDEGWRLYPSGYFDAKVLVQFDDGTLGEVQLWAPGVLEAKNGRAGEINKIVRDLPKDDPQVATLVREESEIYSALLDAASPEWRALIGGIGGNLPNR